MTTAADRRARLARARLYFVTDATTDAAVLRAALEGGVDMLQLRDAAAGDDELLRAAALFRSVCDEHGALFWLNDRPDLATRAQADGVHVGQGDMPVGQARELVGHEVLVGLSTHSPEQLEAGIAAGADQLSVGPVWETPTKPGRPAAGLDYVRHAARLQPSVPWFAIGGIDAQNVRQVAAAGAERAVVRNRRDRRAKRPAGGGGGRGAGGDRARNPRRTRPACRRSPAEVRADADKEHGWHAAVAASGARRVGAARRPHRARGPRPLRGRRARRRPTS